MSSNNYSKPRRPAAEQTMQFFSNDDNAVKDLEKTSRAERLIDTPAGQRLIRQVREQLQSPGSMFYVEDYDTNRFGTIHYQALAFYAAKPDSPFGAWSVRDLQDVAWSKVWREGRQSAEHWDHYPAENPAFVA